MKKILALCSMVLLASGCEERVYTRDGSIPSEYVSYAEKFLGVYEGTFDGVEGQLEITLENLKPRVKFTDKSGQSSILKGCDSKIERLESVDVKANQNKEIERISSIHFKFNPGECSDVEGRTLTLTYSTAAEKKGEIVLDASILHYTFHDFNVGPGFSMCPGGFCSERAEAKMTNAWYLIGSFKKL